MTTSTVQKSQDFNLDRLTGPAAGFEAALRSALEEVGERFGLYDLMVHSGPVTPTCLATQAGISQRAARAWLDALAAGGCLNCCSSADLYCLSSAWPRRAR